MENEKCVGCGNRIYGLGDDYNCPVCHNTFCYYCITDKEKHKCKIKTYSIGNKHNFVKKLIDIGDEIADNIEKKGCMQCNEISLFSYKSENGKVHYACKKHQKDVECILGYSVFPERFERTKLNGDKTG